MAQVDYEFVTTKLSRAALAVESYVYRIDKRVAFKRYWKCITTGCRATAMTEGNVLLRVSPVDAHDHPNDSIDILRREFKED